MLGLDQLHKLGVIYRGMKPENLMLDADGHIVIIDFGRSKIPPDDETMGLTATIGGTIEFQAPEILGAKSYSMSSDYWSVGIILYELIIGLTPFTKGPDTSSNILIQNIMNKPPKYSKDISDAAWDLITKLLQKNPDHRLSMWII